MGKYNGWFDLVHGNDFKCPYCGQELGVENWNTEYGDPQAGDFDVECFKCDKEFTVDIEKQTNYSTRKTFVWQDRNDPKESNG